MQLSKNKKCLEPVCFLASSVAHSQTNFWKSLYVHSHLLTLKNTVCMYAYIYMVYPYVCVNMRMWMYGISLKQADDHKESVHLWYWKY